MTRFLAALTVVILLVLALAAAEGLVAALTGAHEWMLP